MACGPGSKIEAGVLYFNSPGDWPNRVSPAWNLDICLGVLTALSTDPKTCGLVANRRFPSKLTTAGTLLKVTSRPRV